MYGGKNKEQMVMTSFLFSLFVQTFLTHSSNKCCLSSLHLIIIIDLVSKRDFFFVNFEVGSWTSKFMTS